MIGSNGGAPSEINGNCSLTDEELIPGQDYPIPVALRREMVNLYSILNEPLNRTFGNK